MKNVKKVIGILLVVAMLVSAMSTAAFAAVTDGKVIRYVVTSDKASYAAGDVATFTVSVETIAEGAPIDGTVQIDLGYNTAEFAPLATLSATPLATAGVDYAAGPFAGKVDEGNSSANYGSAVGTAFLEADVTAYGWDESVNVMLIPAGTDTYDFSTGLTDLFTIKMNVLKDVAAGEFAVGVNLGGCEMGTNYLMLMGEGYDWQAYDPTYCESEIKVAAPSVVVSHVKQQSKWNGGKVDAANYLFGFVGQVSGLELETAVVGERTMVTNIKSITATATINGQTVTSDVITVWAVDGGYQFRAQFKGFTPDMTHTATVTFAITMNDGTTVYTSDAYGRAINDIYAGSLANNFPALAA